MDACEKDIKEENISLKKIEKDESLDINSTPWLRYSKIAIPSLATLLVGGIIIKGIIDHKSNSLPDDDDNQKEVRGLPNPGLACYMISAIQCLYDDKKFRKVVLNSNISGSNAKKMHAVKEIFKYLHGDINLTTLEIGRLFTSIGYNGTQEESDRIRRKIRSWFIPINDVNDKFEVEYLSTFGDFKSVISDFYHQNKYNDNLSPRIIDINIGRGDEIGKNDKYIQIPEKLEIGKLKFLLTSATVHQGALNGGHYISYVKRGNKWICRNDSSVSSVNWKELKNELGKNSEFLRYEKVS